MSPRWGLPTVYLLNELDYEPQRGDMSVVAVGCLLNELDYEPQRGDMSVVISGCLSY